MSMSERKKRAKTVAKRGLLSLLIVLFIAVIWLAVWSPEPSRIDLNHHRAVERVKEVTLAERNYAPQSPNTGYACGLSDLGKKGLVNAVLASGEQAGYHFQIRCSEGAGQKITSYTVTAVPTSWERLAGMPSVPTKAE